jgi:outer membrane murein-binding lipoprotein Lpp
VNNKEAVMKKFGMMVVSAVVAAGMLSGCGKSEKQGAATAPPAITAVS